MIQAVSSVEAAVQFHVSLHGIYSTKSGTGTEFPLSTAYSCLYHSTNAAHSFIHISFMLDNLSSSQHHYATYLRCSSATKIPHSITEKYFRVMNCSLTKLEPISIYINYQFNEQFIHYVLLLLFNEFYKKYGFWVKILTAYADHIICACNE
jgi:hypothetical protein